LERLGQRLFRLPDRYYKLGAAKKHDVSLIHSHFGNRGYFDLKFARALGLKHITTFYGYDATFLPKRNPQWETKYKRLFDSCNLILAEGPHMLSTIVDLGCPPEKVQIQRIGVNMDRIKFMERKFEGNTVRLLIAGSFVEKKGIPYAIEAIGLVFEKYKNIEVTVIGDAPDIRPSSQKEKERIIGLVNKYGLKKNTRFTGYLTYNELLEEAYRSHIFISPSITASDGDTEGGSPVTITEFAASGMPILATYHCDIPEVVRHNENGLLAKERDVQGLADNLMNLIAQPERWPNMGRIGREHVEKHFNLTVQVKLLEQRYGDILQEA
jgi:colanic acid/amylovoran biosynthesis glycosyltransferase